MKDKEFGYAMKALRMVIRREWHRMTSRRLYLGVCVVLPLLCLFFMATIFGNGQMENIPVGIVDLDNTATSRNISRRISAAPTFRVTEHFTDEADARRALQQKDIYGYLVIPPRFEQKAVTGTGAKGIRLMRADSLKDTLRIVGGRTFVYFMLYVVFSLFLLGLLPHLFSIPHIGSGGDIVTMMIPFLLGTSFLALAVSRWFTDSEAPLLMIAFFSVGYIFLSGVSYPLELMPWYWQTAHYLFPAGPAVLAFVKLNSMGGTLADVWPQMLTMWIQVLVYGTLALCTTRHLYGEGKVKA